MKTSLRDRDKLSTEIQLLTNHFKNLYVTVLQKNYYRCTSYIYHVRHFGFQRTSNVFVSLPSANEMAVNYSSELKVVTSVLRDYLRPRF